MTDTSKRRPVAIRTYAADLEVVRKHQEENTPVESKQQEHSIPKTEPEPVIKKRVVTKSVQTKIPKPPAPISIPPKPPEPAPEPIQTNQTPIKIPAFHELERTVKEAQKGIEAISKETTTAKKTASRPAVRANIGYDATIITDTKSDRFKLFPSIRASIESWFRKLSENRKQKKTPTYTVPEAERRKGVIQRATSQTGTIFTADSDTLKKQILRRRSQQDDTETTLTPNTETTPALLEAPDEEIEVPADVTQHVSVTYKQTSPFVTPEQKSVVVEEETTPVVEVPEAPVITANTEEDALAESRWAASHETGDSIPDTTPTEEMLASPVPPAPPQPPTVHIPVKPTTSDTVQPEIQKPQGLKDTNTLTIVLLIAVVGIITVIFASVVIFKQTDEQADKSAIVVPKEPIINKAKLVNVPLAVQDIEKLPQLIKDAIESSPAGLVEYAIVSGAGDEVSPSYLFELLHFKTMPSLRQSLLSARFESVNHDKPSIVLSFVDVDTVRGGLLNWEASMSQDLHVLYELPTQTFTGFVDDSISGIDVRVLEYNGSAVIVYGFLDDNTALITPSTAAFSQIVELGSLE